MKTLEWYEKQLERDDLSPELRAQYEKEADRLAEQATINQIAAKRRNAEMKANQDRLDMETVDASLRDLAMKVAGDEWEKWLDKSLRLYSIGSGYAVTSIARGPKHAKTVECETMLDAKRRILTLLRTKYNDHFNRGYGFAWDPDADESNEQNN